MKINNIVNMMSNTKTEINGVKIDNRVLIIHTLFRKAMNGDMACIKIILDCINEYEHDRFFI